MMAVLMLLISIPRFSLSARFETPFIYILDQDSLTTLTQIQYLPNKVLQSATT